MLYIVKVMLIKKDSLRTNFAYIVYSQKRGTGGFSGNNNSQRYLSLNVSVSSTLNAISFLLDEVEMLD